MPALPSLDRLPRGHRFAPATYDLSHDWVDAYLAAVRDATTPSLAPETVPPVAVLALAVRALLEQAHLPEGSLHLSQELSCHRAARRGERVTAEATIVSRGERAGWLLLGIELAVRDAQGGPVVSGRATLGVPAGGGGP
ncbi:hypothetical protein HRbin24_01120 [bacterium HR24]|jgi:hypothetical protein|nr:hypothetical protein HRbin24_01120 [bacterium HR24]